MATDLRGRVEGQTAFSSLPVPMSSTAVELADSNGQRVIARAYTGPDGMYYFRGIAPGRYQLRTRSNAYPVTVLSNPTQDIAPIRVKF
jgi:protocatechuate 3,4-dioxygenase beta subunit